MDHDSWFLDNCSVTDIAQLVAKSAYWIHIRWPFGKYWLGMAVGSKGMFMSTVDERKQCAGRQSNFTVAGNPLAASQMYWTRTCFFRSTHQRYVGMHIHLPQNQKPFISNHMSRCQGNDMKSSNEACGTLPNMKRINFSLGMSSLFILLVWRRAWSGCLPIHGFVCSADVQHSPVYIHYYLPWIELT